MRLAWPLLVLAACSSTSAPPVARPASAGGPLRFSATYARGLADGPLDDGHCWSGDHDHKSFESRLTCHERFIPLLVEHFLRTAPAGRT